MKPMVVGIGGAGGNILKKFLETQDVHLPVAPLGEHLAFGDAKGVWLDSATQDTQDQTYFGNLDEGMYPGYLICHGMISADSPLKIWIKNTYGFDLKAQGYDRRAEYLKGIFEVFELEKVKEMARKEFNQEDNPLPGYMWKVGIRPFTVLGRKTEMNFAASAAFADSKDKNPTRKKIASVLGSMSLSMNNRGDSCSGKMQKKLCDSILFLASLGGGTGTGFINPITSYVRREEKVFPIFSLGILTEKGEDARKAGAGQRNLGATIALYDLLTKPAGEGIDALIIIDNEILKNRCLGNFGAMDNTIYSCMKPLLDLRNYPGAKLQDDAPAMKRVFWDADLDDVITDEDGLKFLLPPILVPCYYKRSGSNGGERSLVEHALSEEGRLFPCTPSRADRAYVFTRGYVKADAIASAIEDLTGIERSNAKIYRKLGNGSSDDILILLRNPYGGTPGEQNKKENKKDLSFESRIYDVIASAIDYIDNNDANIIDFLGYSDLTKGYLRHYFYERGGLRDELKKSLQRIADGKKPIFIKQLKIFSEDQTNSSSFEPDPNRRNTKEADEKALAALLEEKLREMLKKPEIRQIVQNIANGKS
ncbi:Tubulin-like protein CetZ [uncultured archaeon]|nr:Tubulin-like protein CetZ [uncultured archaeon]